MFNAMRRKDHQLPAPEVERILREGEYGVLTVHGRNGYPHPVPVNYVYEGSQIWLHCAREGSKLDDIRDNPNVSFCVVGRTELLPEILSTRYESVIVYGKAEELPPDQVEKPLLALVEKYAPAYRDHEYISRNKDKTCVLRIAIEHMTGKARR